MSAMPMPIPAFSNTARKRASLERSASSVVQRACTSARRTVSCSSSTRSRSLVEYPWTTAASRARAVSGGSGAPASASTAGRCQPSAVTVAGSALTSRMSASTSDAPTRLATARSSGTDRAATARRATARPRKLSSSGRVSGR